MHRDQASNPLEESPSLLRAWASIGAGLAVSQSFRKTDWNAATGMIEAARQMLGEEAKRLKQLLTECRKCVLPLEDPFDLDLGLHRWLNAERKEAYSDWLAWVVQQARIPRRVFKLFSLKQPSALLESQHLDVQRECCIPHGHIDQEGRLDLVIRYGDQAIIVVEVKKGGAEGADRGKHGGYKQWLAEQKCPHPYFVFMATSAEEETNKDFLPWADVCIEMRLLAVGLCNERPPRLTAAAMILAFVGAVEQNLLGFSAEFVRKICNGRIIFFNAKIVDHVERFLKKLEAE
jgi:hypothetical protein